MSETLCFILSCRINTPTAIEFICWEQIRNIWVIPFLILTSSLCIFKSHVLRLSLATLLILIFHFWIGKLVSKPVLLCFEKKNELVSICTSLTFCGHRTGRPQIYMTPGLTVKQKTNKNKLYFKSVFWSTKKRTTVLFSQVLWRERVGF